MFIKPGGFKKLIKAAAGTSNGLHVKNEGNAIALDATFFKLWVYRDKIPKEILGELVSVAGMLPDPGTRSILPLICRSMKTDGLECSRQRSMRACRQYAFRRRGWS